MKRKLIKTALATAMNSLGTYGEHPLIEKLVNDALLSLDVDPQIICLCGSTRFRDAFIQAQKDITMQGNIFLTVGMFGHSGDSEAFKPETKFMLDELHLRKIDLADEVFVINVDGYIGESTRNEIKYAESQDKLIRYLENN